jgi:hypothetical protein
MTDVYPGARTTMIRPVKRIPMSEKDEQCLARVKSGKSVRHLDQPPDYLDRVVLKPWGHEFLIYRNDFVAIWFLHINKDHSTSMHCHPAKRTSLSLLRGKALCNTFRHRNFMFPGDSVILHPGVFHSTKALSPEGISVIETETPPNKLDLVRLEDGYGRENLSYEGIRQMVADNLSAFQYFCLSESAADGENRTVGNQFSIGLEHYPSKEAFHGAFVIDPAATYCVCKGALIETDGRRIAEIGETERGGYLRQVERLDIEGETTLLKTTVFGI